MLNAQPALANHQISGIQVTQDLLTDRAGLLPLMKYLDHSRIMDAIAAPLLKYRTGSKGLSVPSLLRQTLAFLFDGTSRHLTRFDQLKADDGYRALLEIPWEQMASSHQIKRFFSKLPSSIWSPFRRLFRQMFASRLIKQRPQVVELFLDTMVLDNDCADVRQGCEPTYKNVKGFQPLQLSWNGMIVDAQFRGGKKNGNHGLTAFSMIKKAVQVIRKHLGDEIPVVVRMDGGFFDGELFWRLDINQIGFVCTGRLSEALKKFAQEQTHWNQYSNKKQTWSYVEFGTRCQSWDRFYRVIYLKPQFDQDQMMLDFARPERVIISNLGVRSGLFHKAEQGVREDLFRTENLIEQHHAKGGDELIHRGLKDFGFQQLPFKKFGANMAFYYLMVIGFNLMVWYRSDILVPLGLVGKGSYATTIRRTAIDFAGKIVRTARKVILKVTQATMERLKLDEVWQQCQNAPPIW
jgi:hypothetical protein